MGGIVVRGCASVEVAGGYGASALARAVARSALHDAGLEPGRLTAVFVASGGTELEHSHSAVAARIALRTLGLGGSRAASGHEPPSEHQVASAAEALHMACHAIGVESDDAVLCLGIDPAPAVGRPSRETVHLRALQARRILHRLGATPSDLAQVVVKNRRHGARQGVARVTSAAEVLAADPLDWPLTRPMLALPGTGAAAVVLTSARVAGNARRRPRVRASAFARLPTEAHEAEWEMVRAAATRAYRESGVGPDELDCAEVHDATAALELAAYDQLGWASGGQAAELAASGFTALGGVLPVNLSGGLLCLGERPGSAAIAQVVALARQLGGQAGAGQVLPARAAMAHGAGAAGRGTAEIVTVTVMTG